MRRSWWLIVWCGCGPQDATLGVVVRDGLGAPGIIVEGDGETTQTDGRGRFELDPGVLATPVTAVAQRTLAVSELSCTPRPWIDLSEPADRPMATLALVLRDVLPEGALRVAWSSLEGPYRAPTSRTWEIEPPDFVQEEGRAGVWTASIQVPVARRWALGVTTLSPAPGRPGKRVSQAMLTTGDALGPGEVRYLDVFMSDETLREPVYWDAEGVDGVDAVTVLQRVQVDDLVLDLPIWHGRIDQPLAIPTVLRDEHDPMLDVQVLLSWPGTSACAGRTAGVTAAIERGVISGRWVEGAAENTQVAVALLRLPEIWPDPPLLEIGDGDHPQLTWSFVPDREAQISFDLQAGDVRWRGAGQAGCADGVVDWPQALDPRGDRRVSGALRWDSASAWGRCTLR